VNDQVKTEMQKLLKEIQSGAFAREWIAEARGGARRFAEFRRGAVEHPIEKVGAKLRAMMPWTEEGKAAKEHKPATKQSVRTGASAV